METLNDVACDGGTVASVCAAKVESLTESSIPEYRVKRVFDFLLAALGLLVSFPFWFLIACAIKLEDGGPVFYRQQRWGRNKKAFEVYKFRTMVVDADERFGAVQAEENDGRFTRVGRFLRATSLDEMPQLLNIWRGEMSWVGPRALPINEKQVNEGIELPDEAIPGFDLRCLVRPGLTGIAQVFAPRDVPRRQKFRYDSFYVKRQSLGLDLKLILLSFWISFRLRWEHRGPKI
jgi:lipopolysaccharide/colanic/teichoic acid biosynthesis glycosyltransferase